MADITLLGPQASSYVRSARIVCAEKGVEHELAPIAFGSDDHRALHPWAKVPVMRHGDVVLYETQAILRYVDAAFDGPSLVPTAPAAIGAMEQWISIHNCYLYPSAVVGYAFQYIFPKGEGGQPDRAAIEAALPKLEHDLGVLDRALAGQPWLAGSFSLADILVAPVITTIAPLPEGGRLVDRCANLRRWLTAMEQRPSAALLQVPRPG